MSSANHRREKTRLDANYLLHLQGGIPALVCRGAFKHGWAPASPSPSVSSMPSSLWYNCPPDSSLLCCGELLIPRVRFSIKQRLVCSIIADPSIWKGLSLELGLLSRLYFISCSSLIYIAVVDLGAPWVCFLMGAIWILKMNEWIKRILFQCVSCTNE